MRPVIARHVRVTGQVQGVFYRGWTKDQADELGVVGWVRNQQDGSVEAYLCGEAEAVAALIERMRRGPPAARVAGIEADDVDPAPIDGFTVRRG